MTKRILFAMVCACAVVVTCYVSLPTEKVTDLLMLENIEALADDENGNYMCTLSGDVDCYGNKVKYKIEGISIN